MIDNISYFRRTVIRQILLILFCISGLSTSIYVIVWIRLFKLVFGDTFFVTNSIIVVFMSGLAIGSYYFGKKIDQKKIELEMFMWFELGIGIYAIFLLIVFPLLTPLHKFIFLQFGRQTVVINVFKFVIAFILLITPSILIGATFPVLCRFFIQTSKRASLEIGNLYFVNILGAVFGCYLTGFFSLPILGIKQTFILGAVFHIINAVMVQSLLNKIHTTIQLETEFYDQKLKHLETDKSVQPQFLIKSVIIGFGISGFLSLSYLVLWFRSLIYVIGTDIYAFYTMLTVFLLGLSIGALLYPRILRLQKNLISIFAIIEILIGFWGIISVLLIPQLVPLDEKVLFSVNSPEAWNWQIIIDIFYCCLIFLIPTFLMGATIPLVSKILLTNFEERGQKIGKIYAVNIFGAILGLNITAFLLVHNVGIQISIIFAAFINFLIGLVILFLCTLKYGKIAKTFLIFGSVAILFCFSLFIPSNFIIKLFQKGEKHNKTIYAREGINTTITLHHDINTNSFMLASNGVGVVGTTIDWTTIQRISGHLPLVLHHRPDTILTIGIRDGETLTSILLHQVKQVDCVEKYLEIIEAYSLINQDEQTLTSNPKLHFYAMDGKNFISLTDTKYDVIINDIVHPSTASNGRLFSQDYFLACKKNLNPMGIMLSVIPLFRISLEDFKIMLHSFQSVFPFTTLWYPNNCLSRYGLLIGSVNPYFRFNYNRISNKLNDPGLITNLAQIGMENIYELLDCFVMGPQIIRELTEGVRLNSDNSPHLEFSTPKTADTPSIWNQTLQLLVNYRELVFPYLTNIDSTLEQKELVRLIIDNYFQSTERVFDALSFELQGKTKQALQIYRQVYMMNRFDRGAKRFFDAYYDTLLIVSPQNPAEFTENATVYYQKMEYEEAINHLNKALELNPDYAPAYFALGINYEIMGDLKNAEKMYQKTLRLKPNLQQAKERLDSLNVKLKK